MQRALRLHVLVVQLMRARDVGVIEVLRRQRLEDDRRQSLVQPPAQRSLFEGRGPGSRAKS
jgi:hypothetical protein